MPDDRPGPSIDRVREQFRRSERPESDHEPDTQPATGRDERDERDESDEPADGDAD